ECLNINLHCFEKTFATTSFYLSEYDVSSQHGKIGDFAALVQNLAELTMYTLCRPFWMLLTIALWIHIANDVIADWDGYDADAIFVVKHFLKINDTVLEGLQSQYMGPRTPLNEVSMLLL
ncbi:hypothetical protein GCK32_020648, partial [Trichostrongylus colubriformis]